MDDISAWLSMLEARYAGALTFAELRKGVVALSRIYVEGRERLERGDVFRGRAKRAAYACFYTPLHYLVVQRIVVALGLHEPAPKRILDLGCGLCAAGAAWSLAAGRRSYVDGIDCNAWTVSEARRTLAALGVRGRARAERLGTRPIARRHDAAVAAFTLNELDATLRDGLLQRLLGAESAVLVVEPISKRATPWWNTWARRFVEAGGRADIWRFPTTLPEPLRKLDQAAGLDHRELTARSLSLCLKRLD